MLDVSKIDCPPPSPSKVLNLEQYHRFLMSRDEIIFYLCPLFQKHWREPGLTFGRLSVDWDKVFIQNVKIYMLLLLRWLK